MIITDEIRQELVGKILICQREAPSLTEGKAYTIIKTIKYDHNPLKTLVVILNDAKKECDYDLMWFVNKERDKIVYYKTTYNDLYFSPISYIRLDGINEDDFIKTLKENEPIIFTSEQRQFTYDKIPKVIKWLQDVYDYCTELKNKIEYVDWQTAKEHMEKDYFNNKARYKNNTYYIKYNELYHIAGTGGVNTRLSLEAINSKEWILL